MLKISNLNYAIGSLTILEEITLNLGSAQSLFIFGKNGSGKSTLLKCISTIYPTDDGTIEILNEKPSNRLSYFSALGCFFNENGFYNYLTVKENFTVFLSYYNINNQEIAMSIAEYSNLFELDELLKKRVKHLSSGQKQRASLALTFMHKPKMLLFDEPLNNLDAYFIDKFYSILRVYIEQNGATAIVVNHDILSTPSWVDKIGLVENKTLVVVENNQTNIQEVYQSIVQK